MQNFNLRKTTQLLNYLACLKGGKITKLMALKLVWLADRLHLRKYGRTITGDSYCAMSFGPVASATKDIIDKKTTFKVTPEQLEYVVQFIEKPDDLSFRSVATPEMKVFSKTDIKVIDEIFNQYGGLGRFELSELSHDFPEWKKFEEALQKQHGKSFPMDLDDFFIDVSDFSGLFVDEEDHSETSKAVFHENQQIRSAIARS